MRYGAVTPQRPGRRKWWLSAAGVLVAGLAAAALLWAALGTRPPADPASQPLPRHSSPPVPTPATPSVGIPAQQPLPSLAPVGIPGGQLALPSPVNTGAIGAAAPPPPPVRPTPGATTPAVAPLTASYTAASVLNLLGYRATVTIKNPAGMAQTGWQIVFQLPAGETVIGATGAKYQQSGATATFTPADAGAVAAHGSVQFTFDVTGIPMAPTPSPCTISGRPCA